MLLLLLQIADLLLGVLRWIIIIQAIMSWLVAFNVINTYNDFVRQLLYALDKITEPIYRPIRRIMPDFGALDLSPLVALLLIIILQMVIGHAEAQVMMAGV
ncbi:MULTISPECIES: YggT family protein [unclassified Sphingomonas]|uniref:YggT family protein n=1 Tax=unclassified Sphingomonas TaxID=196159 RepID=UPI0006FB7939|nr:MULTISPECIES: YggT family protein [unclassified Sphingomonas]KQX25421.1 osmotic-shock protein [Sphingomonas sp. Root1294]KQY66413.1 osmotic-shock protein [Sphingomonas sp. Root50]KRB90437.1 osmotic-shock protein [Sphingomonas sp. Root720]